ncbi:MAG: DUF58 domain-containing protein [Oscillospiraceae bacterium]|nr:DUF58 domain-containing protein [Oscillospiraceae bacterium]
MLKTRLLFIAALIAAALLAIGYEDTNAGFTLLYALLILCAICGFSVAVAGSCLYIEQRAGEDVVFKGEPIRYEISLRNKGPFIYHGAVYRFFSSEVIEMRGDAALGICEPFGKQKRGYTVSVPYRGVYSLGLESVTVTDMLGLFSRTIKNKKTLRLTVFPEREADFALSMRNEPLDTARNRDIFNEDYTAIADLRKYAPADSLRKIHWKLSAKRGELIVKNFQNFEPERTILLLDTAKIDLPTKERAAFEDKMVSYAASAVDFCARAKVPTSLVYGQPGIEETVVGAPEETDGLYSLLARIEFERYRSPIYEMRSVPGSYNIVAFISSLNEQSSAALRELCFLGHSLTIYLFESELRPVGALGEHLIEELRGTGVAVTLIGVDKPDQPAGEEGGAA